MRHKGGLGTFWMEFEENNPQNIQQGVYYESERTIKNYLGGKIMTPLCRTFRRLADETWDRLESARSVNHQLLEESITDWNCLELKLNHSKEVTTRTYNKHEEGINGADWEWWFTGKSGKWLGYRIQAKIIHFQSDKFEHLFYKKGKTSQSTKLINNAKKNNCIPLYCCYAHWPNNSVTPQWKCQSFKFSKKSYGCSLLPIKDYLTLCKNKKNEQKSVIPVAFPWHCLVCCTGFGGTDLPTRSFNFYSCGLDNDMDSQRITAFDISKELPDIPPRHVELALSANNVDKLERPDEDLRGITIIREMQG